MNVLTDRCRWMAALASASAIILVFVGCQGSGSKASADSSRAKSSDNAELFTIPQEQMAHVQVLTVQPTMLPRPLLVSGPLAYTTCRTPPLITQVSGPVSRV